LAFLCSCSSSLIWGNSRPLTWGSGSGISSGGLSLAFCSFLCSIIDEYPSGGESHRDSEIETRSLLRGHSLTVLTRWGRYVDCRWYWKCQRCTEILPHNCKGTFINDVPY
jgi:hypothetical protein